MAYKSVDKHRKDKKLHSNIKNDKLDDKKRERYENRVIKKYLDGKKLTKKEIALIKSFEQ